MSKVNAFFRKDSLWIILLSIIILLPNIYFVFYGGDACGASGFKRIFYISVSCFFFILPAFFLKARPFFLLQGLFMLAAPLEIGHVYLNRMPATSAFLLSIVDTNLDESTELLGSIKVPIVLLLIVWAFYFFITIRKIDNRYWIRSKKIAVGAFVLFFASVFAGYATDYNKRVYPYDLIYRSYQVYVMKKEMKDGREKMRDFRFNAHKSVSSDEKEVYVFVIGETGRYDSYSLNGYARETSPLLSKTKGLISYSDFFSEANITSSCLSLLLTRASARDYNRSFVEKSFVDAFKEAGFKTYWIADQSANNNFIRRISKDTDKEYFKETTFKETDNFDEQLWPFLEKVLSQNDQKVLIVLHTLGSHFRYNFRYPSRFEVFKPSLQGDFDYALIASKNKKQFVNTYDNSILYTDYFLANTIRKIDSLQAVSALVYVADHGENLFDTDENIVFHGGSQFTKYDFHVPLFIWTSEQYNRQYPDKAENLYRNKDKKLSSHHLFYSLLDMADITFPEQILSESIASSLLKEDSVRYVVNTNMEVKEGF